jgi:hypothetical protein
MAKKVGTVGTVTVADDGSATGYGLAYAIYDYVLRTGAERALPNFTDPTIKATAVGGYKDFSEGLALAICDAIDYYGFVTPEMYGAAGDGSVDDAGPVLEAANEAAERGVALLLMGRYRVDSPLAFADGVSLRWIFVAGATLDFRAADIANGSACITVGTDTGGLTALPALAVDANKGDEGITFASVPDLETGDLFVIWNDDDGSWIPNLVATRPYYKAGEWCRVRSVSDVTAAIDTELFDSYLSTDNIHLAKVTTSRVSFEGDGTILVPETNKSIGILLWNAYRSSISGLELTGARWSHIALYRCAETSVCDCRVSEFATPDEKDYAVIMIACWDCCVDGGSYRTCRHAISITGGDIAASLPNRICGARNATLRGDMIAADMHGAVEYCYYQSCNIFGGVNLAGDHSRLEGCKIFSCEDYHSIAFSGACIRFRELRGATHTIRNCECEINQAYATGEYPIHF